MSPEEVALECGRLDFVVKQGRTSLEQFPNINTLAEVTALENAASKTLKALVKERRAMMADAKNADGSEPSDLLDAKTRIMNVTTELAAALSAISA